MKYKTIKTIFIITVFIAITHRANYLFINAFSPSFDVVSTATNIVDGDTFDIASGDTIRLADVDTPEYYEVGYNEASNFLSELIYNKRVYLDVDDIHTYDTLGKRIVCCVYVDYNSTHYLNVNDILLELNYARIWDHDNEFNPYTWSLFLPKLDSSTRLKFLGVSFVIGIIMTYLIYRVVLGTVKIITTGLYNLRAYARRKGVNL